MNRLLETELTAILDYEKYVHRLPVTSSLHRQ